MPSKTSARPSIVKAPAASAATPEAKLDTFVAKLDAKSQALFRALRRALKKRFPSANELAYDYSFALVLAYAPGDHGIDAIFALRASADGVSLYFSQGPKLADPSRLLKGTGKQTRYIAMQSANQLKEPDVEALITATLEQARMPFAATGKGLLIIKSDDKSARKSAKKPTVNAAKRAPTKAVKTDAKATRKTAKKAAKR